MAPAARQPCELKGLPPDLERIYKEVIEAYNCKLHLLVVAGSRMILEGICSELKITYAPDSRELVLAERFHLLESRLKFDSGILEEVRKVCNDAIHKLQVDQRYVDACVHIAEQALMKLYPK